MKENELKDLLQEIRKELEPVLKKSGTVFYSGRQTLGNGNFYLMGLNPGGDPGDLSEGTIGASLDKWEEYRPDWSAYIHDNWTKTLGNEGNAQHQRNVRYLCEEVLNESSANVFSANAIFLRSQDFSKLEISGQFLSQYCKLHVRFLREVKPRVLICLGNGPGSSFDLVREWIGGKLDVKSEPCGFRGRARVFVRWVDANAQVGLFGGTRSLRILGVPHPSHYWYRRLDKFDKVIRALV